MHDLADVGAWVWVARTQQPACLPWRHGIGAHGVALFRDLGITGHAIVVVCRTPLQWSFEPLTLRMTGVLGHGVMFGDSLFPFTYLEFYPYNAAFADTGAEHIAGKLGQVWLTYAT